MQIFLANLRLFFSDRLSRAVGLIFLVDGSMYGSWSTLIPFIKHKFNLDEAQLGLLLFALPLGITISNPLAAILIRRFGMRRSTLFSLFMVVLTFAVPIRMSTIAGTGLSLFFCGVFFSVLNVGMNTCATALERFEKRRIMSTCHGMWSLGAMMGSGIGGMITGWGVSPEAYMTGASVLVALVGGVVRGALMELREMGDRDSGGLAFRWPTRVLWGLIALSLGTNLVEGAVADWAAVYMRDVLASPAWQVGWGFAAYAFFMAAGRLAGDVLTTQFGNRRLLVVGGWMVAAGFGCLVAGLAAPLWLLGFSLIGAGVSLGAPILYSSASRVPGMSVGAGLATMNTFAMAAFLSGPTLIGFLAQATSLRFAFLGVGLVAVLWSIKAAYARGLDSLD